MRLRPRRWHFGLPRPCNGQNTLEEGRYGYGQVLLMENARLVVSEEGDLVLVDVSPQEGRELARTTPSRARRGTAGTCRQPTLRPRRRRGRLLRPRPSARSSLGRALTRAGVPRRAGWLGSTPCGSPPVFSPVRRGTIASPVILPRPIDPPLCHTQKSPACANPRDHLSDCVSSLSAFVCR